MAEAKQTSNAGMAPLSEQGFSLVEALVILAISSILMLVLTNTISLARDQNVRLADHARLSGDQFYADLQVQALIDRLYIDPLLQSYGAQPSRSDSRAVLHTEQSWADLESETAFQGTSEQFEFLVMMPNQDAANVQPVKIAWLDQADGRRLSMTLGDETIIWPVLYDAQTRFSYLNASDALVATFPSPSERSAGRTERPNPILLPKSILAYQEGAGDILFVIDVP